MAHGAVGLRDLEADRAQGGAAQGDGWSMDFQTHLARRPPAPFPARAIRSWYVHLPLCHAVPLADITNR